MTNAILHLVNQSPSSNQCLHNCLQRYVDGDGIFLFSDAVYAVLLHGELANQLKQTKIYALQEDIDARGIQLESQSAITLVDYDQFVQLTIDYPLTLSWY